MRERVKTGIIGLDKLLLGGFREHTVTVVVGSAGTGKTTFAMQFLREGILKGEPAVFIVTEVSEDEVLDLAEAMGWHELIEAQRNGDLQIIPTHAGSDLSRLPDIVFSDTSSKFRVVLDSLTPFLLGKLDDDMREIIADVFSKMRKAGTAVVTVESPERIESAEWDETVRYPIFLADTVITLDRGGLSRYNFLIKILKHRGSGHALDTYAYRILPGYGIVIDAVEFEPFKEEAYQSLSEESRKVADRFKGNIVLDEEVARFMEIARKELARQ